MENNSIYTEDGKGYVEPVCKLLHEKMKELLSEGKTKDSLPFSIALNERVLQLKNPNLKLICTETLNEELLKKDSMKNSRTEDSEISKQSYKYSPILLLKWWDWLIIFILIPLILKVLGLI